ncbi:MAG: Rieske (2Fe-2S) protein [Jaaginema sp. PMC 1079.18]|nr:Rieske (2Fe-2S) protein [Jaaginema sp. PMC 1080.18]MEC4852440.1 Rieske (2Fe-2S) protein [Jaaginema sp. PMC 1079.18]MEC4868496.1 Rieske (2Fe-2S) protein [Jaaginema sp. PMC 1078.18]
MDRRQFLGWMSVGAIASSLPIALAACNSNSETTTETEPTESPEAENTESPADMASETTEDGFTQVGTTAQLDEKGFILDENAATPVIAIRNPDTQEIVALNPTCTHNGCTVAYDAEAKEFACPCHGAKYDMTGAVTNGPAEVPLSPLEAKEEGEVILVKMS